QDERILRGAQRISLVAAVAQREIEIALRAEDEASRVVIGEWLWLLNEDALGADVCFGRIRFRDLHLADDAAQHVGAGVVQVELAVFRELRVEGETEQAHFAAPDAAIRDVEEDGSVARRLIAGENDDPASLQHQKEALRAV